ncbi:TRAP transporter small permease [Agrococcus sp. TSP3-2-1]|uniref:TRAP transporter small permease n=1 Tax=Agrococcus sp. TSP3-2-1 TaxID=2804583 RepID=UPI003CEB00B4
MRFLRTSLRLLVRIMIVVNVVLVAATTILLLGDVLLRNIVGRPLPMVYDLTELFVLVISCTALVWLDGERDHIGFSILVDRLKPTYRVWVEVFWRICSLPVLAMLAVSGIQRTVISFETNEARMGLLELPVWPSRLLLAIAFTALTLLALFYILDAIFNRRITSIVDRAQELEAEGTMPG